MWNSNISTVYDHRQWDRLFVVSNSIGYLSVDIVIGNTVGKGHDSLSIKGLSPWVNGLTIRNQKLGLPSPNFILRETLLPLLPYFENLILTFFLVKNVVAYTEACFWFALPQLWFTTFNLCCLSLSLWCWWTYIALDSPNLPCSGVWVFFHQ